MADIFEFLTIDDLKDCLDEASITLLQNAGYQTMPVLEQIKKLCVIFQQKISDTTIDNSQIKNTYLLGMKIVYYLRAFLLQEQIIFSIGAESPTGELSVKEINQQEIFNSINVNLETCQLELNSAIERFDPDNVNQSISDLWKKVVLAAKFDWSEGYDTKKIYITSGKKRRYVYSKPNPDTNVWVRYYMKQKQRYLTRYYNKSLNDSSLNLIGYNQGWLYEWFQEYIQDKESQLQLQAAFDANSNSPLSGMFLGAVRENIEGYKGGDYIDAQGQQVQAKFKNKRIATFNTIKTVIANIIEIINDYEKTLSGEDTAVIQKMAQRFLQLFTDKRIKINYSYEKIVDQLISPLQKK